MSVTTNNGMGGNYMTSSIDDLIPEELRQAVEKLEKPKSETKTKVDDDEEDLELPEYKNAPSKESDEDEEEEDQDEEEDDNEESYEESEGDDDEDLSLESESIDKLLSGELDAVSKKKKKSADVEQDEDIFWHDDEDYTEIVNKLNYSDVDQKELDKLIKKVADKKTLDTSKYVQGLTSELSQLKKSRELLDSEIKRLKEVERAAHFDNSPEVQEKYGKPISDSILAIKDVLDLEGIDVSIREVIDAKDRTSLNRLLEDYAIDDASKTKLQNHWKNYRELQMQYEVDKSEAKNNLKKHLSTNIPEETATKILRNGLANLLKTSEEMKYIQDGIDEGLDKNKEVNDVLALAKQNFFQLVSVLSTPSEYVHNHSWLEGLAKYVVDASHSRNLATKYHSEVKEKQRLEKDLAKVVKAYKKLAGSAKGITGDKNGVGYFKGGSRKADKESSAEILEEFNDLLKGKISF